MGFLALDNLVGSLQWAEETRFDGDRCNSLFLASVTRIVFQVTDLLQTFGVLRLEQNVLLRNDGEFGRRLGFTQRIAGHARIHTAVVDRDEFDSQRDVTEIEEIGDARTGLQWFPI